MAECSSCAAPLFKIVCDYCGTKNDLDFRNIENFSSTKPTETRYCPECKILLDTINLSKKSPIYIERCHQCHGLFFDKDELQSFIDISVEFESDIIDTIKLKELSNTTYSTDLKVLYRRCPVCDKFMQRKNYFKKSGIILDRCRDHGIWLDAGEIKDIMEFVRLGGRKIFSEEKKSFAYSDYGEKEDTKYENSIYSIFSGFR